jgi:hypothetical protein
MTYIESLEVLDQLEDLLDRQLIDTTDPEVNSHDRGSFCRSPRHTDAA